MRTSGEGNGDGPETFEALALPLLSSLYNFARWLTNDGNEAEDLVQEAFVRALRGFRTFEEGTNFRAWIFRILRNAFLSSRSGGAGRLRRATVPLSSDEGGGAAGGEKDGIAAEPGGLSSPETPESILIAAVERRLVRDAIAALPEPTREVVLLRDVEGLSYREISEILELPVGTVMSRLSRGREAIRRAIRGKG